MVREEGIRSYVYAEYPILSYSELLLTFGRISFDAGRTNDEIPLLGPS